MENNGFVISKGMKILIGIFIVYLLVMLVIFLPGYLRRQREKLYIITDTYKIKYEKGKWKNIVDKEDYRLKEFDIYENNQYKGNYQVIYNNKFYLYENGKKVSTTGSIFAHRGSLSLKLINKKIEDRISETDKIYIKTALEKVKLSETYDYNFIQKIVLDLDNDGIEEYIYCLNNFYEENQQQRFSILFTVDDNEVNVINKVITDDDGVYDNPIYFINDIFDIRDDGKLEMIYTFEYTNGSKDNACPKLINLSKSKEIHDFCD